MTDAVAEAQAKAKADESQAAEIAAQEAAKTAEAEAQETQEPAPSTPDLSGTVVEQVAELVTAAGLLPSDVAQIVSENGGNLTPALFKTLVDEHGEATTNLIADNLRAFNETAITKGNAVDNEIYSQVKEAFKGVTEQSGEDTWKELSAWAKENIPNAERQEVNELLAKGGLSAKFAVDHLVSKFRGDAQYSQSANLEEGEGSNEDQGVAMIDKATYDRELRSLMEKGHDYNTSPEIATLQRKRLKAIRRGR